jgi:hypothetical protein
MWFWVVLHYRSNYEPNQVQHNHPKEGCNAYRMDYIKSFF